MVLELDVGDKGWVHHLVDSLGLASGLQLHLLLIGQGVHAGGSAVGVVRDYVPAAGDIGLFEVALASEEALGLVVGALGGCGAAPFPIEFAVSITVGKTKLRGPAIIIRFDTMSHNEFTSEVSPTRIIIELTDGIRTVVVTKFVDDCRDGKSELTIEDSRTILAVNINIVLASTRIDTVDDIFIVLIDEHRRSAEDDEVEVVLGDAIIEV